MKNISYCDTIEQILISQAIDCDGIVISNHNLEYTILYHSELKHLFTDDLLQIGADYIKRELLIKGFGKILKSPKGNISQLIKTLSSINTSATIIRTLSRTKEYFETRNKLNKFDQLNYIKFYNSAADTCVWLNIRCINSDFKDILQTKISPSTLEGSYSSSNTNHQLAIYFDQFSKQWILEGHLDSS